MKKVLNIFFSCLLAICTQTCSLAESTDKVITKSGINKSSIAVSVRDIKTGKTLFALNQNQPMIPASTLKLVTLYVSLDTLGKDYEFVSGLYKTADNDLYLKTGADPHFSSSGLKDMIKTAMAKKIVSPKNFYIDDFITDGQEWGEGWQWDDDLNPLMPKFSSYNIDRNLLGVVVTPTGENSPANITTSKFYPITFMNLVITGKTNDIKISRNNHISPDIITAQGTVNKQTVIPIPVNNPKRYYMIRLEEAVRDAKMDFYGDFKRKKTPKNVYTVYEYKTPVSDIIPDILLESSNLSAESVFKVAGAKYANNTGSLANSQEMFNAYCKKAGINNSDIKITDGSGVSKNNIMTADFMTNFLVNIAKKEDFKDFKNQMATSSQGTLSNRMLYFKDNIRAKTGTLSDVSAIAGYITTRNGKEVAFDIMINNPKVKNQDKKILEEHILRTIYSQY